jgi:purine nucleosidase
VAIAPADSFKKPAVKASRALLQFLGMGSIPVFASDNAGVHPFPDEWRKDSIRLANLPELAALSKKNFDSPAPSAVEQIVGLLSGHEMFDILETGPLTNIAEALQKAPNIQSHIRRIFVMGGAVHVPGNVEMPGHDGTAEWNFYNNPEAARRVVSSGIPITLVSLDSTNQVPVTRDFMARLKAQQRFPVSRLFYEAWGVINAKIEAGNYQNTYFFWDTLAAAVLLRQDLVKTVSEKVVVVVQGKSQGRVMESPNGQSVDMVTTVDPNRLHEAILQLFRK